MPEPSPTRVVKTYQLKREVSIVLLLVGVMLLLLSYGYEDFFNSNEVIQFALVILGVTSVYQSITVRHAVKVFITDSSVFLKMYIFTNEIKFSDIDIEKTRESFKSQVGAKGSMKIFNPCIIYG